MGVEWLTLIIQTCVTVVFALNNNDHLPPGLALNPMAAIFTAYVFAVFLAVPAHFTHVIMEIKNGNIPRRLDIDWTLILTAPFFAVIWVLFRENLPREPGNKELVWFKAVGRQLIVAMWLGTESRTTIFTAYFFGGILYATRSTGPDVTGFMMTQSNFLDGIPILTRFVIDVYVGEMQKRQRELRGGR